MATESPFRTITLPAAGNLSSKQYHFVYVNGSGEAAVITGTTQNPIGVLQNKPAAQGDACEIMQIGISKVVADAAVTVGNLIGPSADGQADPKADFSAQTDVVCGVALSSCSNAGEYVSVSINCPVSGPSKA